MDKVPHKDFCIIMVIIFTLIIFLIFWSCMITSFVSSYKGVCLFDPIISWDKYELFKTL